MCSLVYFVVLCSLLNFVLLCTFPCSFPGSNVLWTSFALIYFFSWYWPWGKKAPPALLCVSGGIWQFTFWDTATVSRLKTCKQQTMSSWGKWGEPVKANTITASPPPADTSQSQKKIRFWQDLLFYFIWWVFRQEIPGRYQTGRCIWAPHHSQDPCVPWSLVSLRLHAPMQVRRKRTEKWDVQPGHKMRVATEEKAAMRLRGTCQRRSAAGVLTN